MPTRAELMVTGTESAQELMRAYPGDRNPHDYVHVRVWENGTTVTVTASYTPIGHGIARVASVQYMDAQARKSLPGAHIVLSGETHSFGAFSLGSVARQYEV